MFKNNNLKFLDEKVNDFFEKCRFTNNTNNNNKNGCLKKLTVNNDLVVNNKDVVEKRCDKKKEVSDKKWNDDNPVMLEAHAMHSVEFPRYAKEAIDYLANYFEDIDKLKVFPSVKPGYIHKMLPSEAPLKSDKWENILDDMDKIVLPGITHWHHPHFHAYFPASNSYPAIIGEILASGIGCIGFTWASSPACTELEVVMMDWLAKAIELPQTFLSTSPQGGGGVIYHSCSEATLVALFAARNKKIDEYISQNSNLNKYEIMSKLVGYYSDQAHSSVERAGLLSMIQMRPVKSVNRKMMRHELEKLVREDLESGYIPFYCVATLGTTGSCAFDALEEIGELCNEHDIWLHVDAAYAGSSFICPENRYLMKGIENAMSFVFNAHKWLLVNFDCTAVWFKESKYVVETFTVDPVYLKHQHQGKCPDFRHWHIPLGRKFRSLKIWFVLRMYGIEKLQEYIRNHINLAKLFEKLILSDERFEVVEPVTMGLVAFRLKSNNVDNENLYTNIEQDGRIHLVTGNFVNENILYLRFAVCYQFATAEHIHYAYNTIIEIANNTL